MWKLLRPGGGTPWVLSGSDIIDDYLQACEQGCIGSKGVRHEWLKRTADKLLLQRDQLIQQGSDPQTAATTVCQRMPASQRARSQRCDRLLRWAAIGVLSSILFAVLDIVLFSENPPVDFSRLVFMSVFFGFFFGYFNALTGPTRYSMRHERTDLPYLVGHDHHPLSFRILSGLAGTAAIAWLLYSPFDGNLLQIAGYGVFLFIIWWNLLISRHYILVTADNLVVQSTFKRTQIPRSAIARIELRRRSGLGIVIPDDALYIQWQDENAAQNMLRFSIDRRTNNADRMADEHR